MSPISHFLCGSIMAVVGIAMMLSTSSRDPVVFKTVLCLFAVLLISFPIERAIERRRIKSSASNHEA